MMEHPHDDIEAFALGALDDLAMRRVLAHADACPSCAVLLAEAMTVTNGLEDSGERKPVRGLQFNDLRGSRNIFSGPLAARPSWAMALLSLTAACFVLIWGINVVRGWNSSTLTVPVASLVHSHFQHHSLHGARGSAKVIQAIDGRWLYLLADGLSPRTRYMLSETISGNPRLVGAFATDSSGRATAYFEQSPEHIQALSVKPESARSDQQYLNWP